MSTIRRAIEIALEAHDGQTDRGGSPYIFHPLRVMLSVEGDSARMAAVLHDVVEDSSDWTMERLSTEGFSSEVMEAVGVLTKVGDEDYFEYVRRVAQVPTAVLIKLADLADNLDPRRLGREPTKEDEARFARYREARRILKSASSQAIVTDGVEKTDDR